MTSKERCWAAIHGRPVDRVPVFPLLMSFSARRLGVTYREFATSGPTMIGAGDAAASLISPEMYREFALPYEQRVCAAIHAAGGLMKLHICGNTTRLLSDMVSSGADLFNVDHLVDFSRACEVYGQAGKCFKGNLNPVAGILQADAECCQQAARACLAAAEGKRYMLSAGCEIPGEVSDGVFRAFCEAARHRTTQGELL